MNNYPLTDEQMSEDFNREMSEDYNLPIKMIEQVSEKYKNETPPEFFEELEKLSKENN